MEQANPLPRQVQIYNPFPTRMFRLPPKQEPEFDFLYLGRLISEKGVDTLLHAFASIASPKGSAPPTLLVIGDGPERANLEGLAEWLGVRDRVNFVGNQSGESLIKQIARGRIAVIPSAWAEPMGGVAVELMAAGRSVIVSKDGGLAECVGDAGLTFPNGNAESLAGVMTELSKDRIEQSRRAELSILRARDFHPEPFIDRYVELLREIVRIPVPPAQPSRASDPGRLNSDAMPL